MVKLIAFYKSTKCTNGFYTEAFEAATAMQPSCVRQCNVCNEKHQFIHDKNHMVGGSSATKLLEDWANKNNHEFGVAIKDIK